MASCLRELSPLGRRSVAAASRAVGQHDRVPDAPFAARRSRSFLSSGKPVWISYEGMARECMCVGVEGRVVVVVVRGRPGQPTFRDGLQQQRRPSDDRHFLLSHQPANPTSLTLPRHASRSRHADARRRRALDVRQGSVSDRPGLGSLAGLQLAALHPSLPGLDELTLRTMPYLIPARSQDGRDHGRASDIFLFGCRSERVF